MESDRKFMQVPIEYRSGSATDQVHTGVLYNCISDSKQVFDGVHRMQDF